MAHEAQQLFCEEVRRRFPDFFCRKRVLEIGSRCINGAFRGAFSECDYVGVDCTAGAGVDMVCHGHQYEAPLASFDVGYSTETFEHDPFAEETLACMTVLLKPGGLLFGTCAGEGRPEHGTRRTGKAYGPDPDFYHNVGVQHLRVWLTAAETWWAELLVRHEERRSDL